MAIVAAPGGALTTTGGLSGGLPASGFTEFGDSFGGQYDQFWAAQSYSEMYRCNEWVAIPINKLAGLLGQNPHCVYRRMDDDSRVESHDMPFGKLMYRPSPMMPPQIFWQWWYSTYFTQGEAVALKLRDPVFGKPVGLAPIHPTRLRYGPDNGGHKFESDRLTVDEITTGNRWWFISSSGIEVMVLRRDLVIWPGYNPHSLHRGMSRLEPLRKTLERRALTDAASAALLRQGGRPSFVLKHPKRFKRGTETSRALATQFANRHGGVENWGKPLVLQEGMEAVPLPIDQGLNYLQMREQDEETIAAMFNLPQPAVGILRRATFNNVVELMRMVGRDTVPPFVTSFESVIDFELRDGRFDRTDLEPEFGEDFYFNIELEGMLRGNPEQQIDADAKAIQTGQKTPAEVRAKGNRTFIEGSDQLLVNGALVPIAGAGLNGTAVVQLQQNRLTEADYRGVMGRLSRPPSPDVIEVGEVVEGLDGPAALLVAGVIDDAKASGTDMAGLRSAVKELAP